MVFTGIVAVAAVGNVSDGAVVRSEIFAGTVAVAAVGNVSDGVAEISEF